MGDPTDPGSEVAFSLDTCSIAALLSVIMTARDYSSAQLSSQDVWRTSPLSSKKHSRVPFSVLRGPMASNLIVKVLPCSMEMVISSLIAGLARKYRVGTTLDHQLLESCVQKLTHLRSPYLSIKPWNSSKTLGYMQ
jgi:hypothetical protein